MDLLEHFELHPIIELHLFGLDLSITNAVVMMWLACFLLLVFLTLAARRNRLVPSGLQNFVEMVVQFIRNNLVLETIGEEGLPWFPFIATLFFFILMCNLLGLVPGGFTATSNINVTAILAIVVFLATQAVGFRKHGLIGYLKGFIPKDLPLWILPLMLPVEILSQFTKPFSLAVRLFANMMAGHTIIFVFMGVIVSSKSFLGYIIAPLPLAGVIVMSAFEIFVAIIQAYIFAILAALYISQSIHLEH